MSSVGPETNLETVGWSGNASEGCVRLVDQTLLPSEFVQVDCRDVPSVWNAIKTLKVRGAPAIGIAAAFGAVLGGQKALGGDVEAVRRAVHQASASLRTSRPTAVNLFWALDRIDRVADAEAVTATAPLTYLERVLAEAQDIADEDKAMCRAIGQFGAGLIEPGQGVLTHCNAGGLATADYGTALAVVFAAFERGDAPPRLRGRDPPLAPGGQAHRLGTPAPGDSRYLDLRQYGRAGDEGAEDRPRGCGCRPDRVEWRYRKQDRHLRRGLAGQGARHPILRCRPFEYLRPHDC